jgi:hypothetical protein
MLLFDLRLASFSPGNWRPSGKCICVSGAPIANAKITLRNNARQVEFHSTTNETGSYSLAGVPEGGYTFVIEAGGFARYEKVSRWETQAAILCAVGRGASR